jgi:hypothetical protein
MHRAHRIALAVAFALAFPTVAQADGFAGLACRYLNGADPQSLNPFVTALNGTDATQAVVCDANPMSAPLGLDSPTEGEVNRVLVGSIMVIDSHPTEDINCSLFTLDRNGGILQSNSVASSGIVNNANIADPGILQLAPAEPDARAMLLCFVPGVFAGQPSGLVSLFATSDFD